jgi:hypothetical protein
LNLQQWDAGRGEVTSPGFFEMFGIRRLQGRDFLTADDDRATAVAILNDGPAFH